MTGRVHTRLWLAVALGVLSGCASLQRKTTNTAAPERIWLTTEWTAVGAQSGQPQHDAAYSASERSLRIDAARNEVVAFQIVIPPNAAGGDLRIEVGDLTGSAGVLPAADVARIYQARYVRVTEFPSWYREHTGRPSHPTDFPDVLSPVAGQAITPDRSRNQIVWVDLNIPSSAAPGDYAARVRVERAAGLGAAAFDGALHLRVLPILLPQSTDLPALARFDPKPLLRKELGWPDEPGAARLNPRLPEHAEAMQVTNGAMRLLHEHGLDAILWAALPHYEDANDGSVQVDWTSYDAANAAFISGSAFAEGGAPRYWPVPADRTHPDAERYGGFDSPRYARALASYLSACEEHFRAQGWDRQAFVRILPPSALNESAQKALSRASRIVKQSEVTLPLAAHFPASSLRSLGWHQAPQGTQAPVEIWIPPGMWLQPDEVQPRAEAGEQTWLMPDQPPYSGSLAVATAHTDPLMLPWLAHRYGLHAIWIEDAGGQPISATAPSSDWTGLLYPGTEFGAGRQPLPSMRLKRLRRGIQDMKILGLLKQHGKPLLATTSSRRLVQWGLTEAALENLLARRPTGWPVDGEPYRAARRVALQELGATFDDAPGATATTQPAIPASAGPDWGRFLSAEERLQLDVRGVRLIETDEGLRGAVFVSAYNTTNMPINGVWTLPNPPRGWRLERAVAVETGPNERKLSALQVAVDSFHFDEDGVYPFELLFESQSPTLSISETLSTRLALTACPFRAQPPQIDARMEDWQLAGNNAAGDFQLVRPGRSASVRPTNQTYAFFSMDADNLYIAVRCLQPNEPVFRNTNQVQVQAGVPWGEDIVEILLDPRGIPDGTSGDIYCLQVKPNGLLVARKGCLTDPPMGPSEPWISQAQVATGQEPNGWVVELAIPLTSFDVATPNNLWGCNITRQDAANGEYSSWSGAQATCYLPRSMGNLVLMRP